MADNAKAYPGFKALRSKSGGAMPEAIRVPVASGYTGAINGGTTIDIRVGDPVRRLATGYFAHAAGNEAAGNNGETIYGICTGIAPYFDGSVMTYGDRLPANTVYGTVLERTSWIYVIPAHLCYWEIDCDDKVTATTEAAYRAFIGENADHILTTGSEPRSNCLLKISSHVATTAQWRIEGISESFANQDFSGLYVKLVVTLNEGQQPEFTASGI